MQSIPSIKQSGGIFEIFVPGLFLFLNFLATAFVAWPNEIWNGFIPFAQTNLTAVVALVLVLFICFGFLLGMVLRLLKAGVPDRFSAYLSKKTSWKENWPTHLTEPFPYIKWMGENVKNYLPKEAQDFYDKVWEVRLLPDKEENGKKIQRGNKRFLNHCKNLLDVKDNQLMIEIHANEAQLRFLAGMFYSLFISLLLLILALSVTEFKNDCFKIALAPGLLYLLCFFIIAFKFRAYRAKEVEELFDATFQNRELFLEGEKLKKTKLD